MGSTIKIGNHFTGRNMMLGIHMYLQTKPFSPASQVQTNEMLILEEHPWFLA
jgi:hypothetical protein